jgi:hypothetical protein
MRGVRGVRGVQGVRSMPCAVETHRSCGDLSDFRQCSFPSYVERPRNFLESTVQPIFEETRLPSFPIPDSKFPRARRGRRAYLVAVANVYVQES